MDFKESCLYSALIQLLFLRCQAFLAYQNSTCPQFVYRRAGTGPQRPPSHLGLHRKLYKQVYNVEQDKPLDGMASGKAGLVLYSGQGACLHRPSELPQLVQKAPPCLLTSVTTENGPLSAQPLYPIPRQASSSKLGGNNPSTRQDSTSKISPRPSHPVGSTVSVCGSFISLHPLPLAKNTGQSSQILPPPQVCKLEGSASVLSDEKGGYPLLWGQAGPGIRALVPPRLYGEGVSEDRRPEEGSGNGRERVVLDLLPPVSFSVYGGRERLHLAACVWG